MQSNNEIVSRDDLIRKLWDDERFVNDNTLTVNVTRLRQKLAEIGLGEAIVTKKGLGLYGDHIVERGYPNVHKLFKRYEKLDFLFRRWHLDLADAYFMA